MNKNTYNAVILISGIALASIGAYRVLTYDNLKLISGLLVGVGAGLFGMAAGNLIAQALVKKNPDFKRQVEIERKDERNNYINNLAKAKAFDITTKLYLILLIAYVLLQRSSLTLTLLMGTYLLGWIIYVVLFNKLSKQM